MQCIGIDRIDPRPHLFLSRIKEYFYNRYYHRLSHPWPETMNHDNTKTPCPHKALSVLARTLESQRRQSILPLRDLIGQKAALLVSHLSTAYAVHSFLTDSPSSFLSLTICLTSLDLFYHPFTNFSLFPPSPFPSNLQI